ncbi:MAG: ferritin-like domain-containing protein [Planctomycetota bacterium]|jgi:bacterioferritin|nr:ferritin-like domain-containing protein [Planctomycetota bacterium]
MNPMPDAVVIERLNEILAEEVEAAVRYLHLAMSVKGLDRLLVRDTLFEGMQETLQHAQMISERLSHMGANPRIRINIDLESTRISGAEAIQNAVAVEEQALEAYRELLELVENDIALEEFVRDQVSLETQHVADLRLLLED